MDAFNSEPLVINEFGCINGDYQGLIANGYFSIQFVKRQANRPAHYLARAGRFSC